jgi:hypothetical protein
MWETSALKQLRVKGVSRLDGTSSDSGKYYVSASAWFDDIGNERNIYLHADGLWRCSTINEAGVYSAFFDTRKIAATALKQALGN